VGSFAWVPSAVRELAYNFALSIGDCSHSFTPDAIVQAWWSCGMLTGQLLRYVLVGLANTAIGYGCILLLRYGLHWSDLAANAGGYGMGACASYLLNRSFTFQSQRRHGQALPRFVLAMALCYALNAAVLLACLQWLHWPSFASQALALCAYTVAFFVLSRTLVFRAEAG
jgi:putative flippase GtrA